MTLPGLLKLTLLVLLAVAGGLGLMACNRSNGPPNNASTSASPTASAIDDLARSRVWLRVGRGVGGVFGRARRRAATAAASLLGTTSRH